MQIRVTGPVEVIGDDQERVDLEPLPKQIIATLVLLEGRIQTAAELVRLLHDEEPDDKKVNSVRSTMSSLRRTKLGTERLPHGLGGYRLDIRPGDYVDLHVFRAYLAAARRYKDAGDLEVARELFKAALDAWAPGPPLPNVPTTTDLGLAAELQSVLAAREYTHEAYAETCLKLGHHRELLEEFPKIIAAHPGNEYLVELYMLALHRCGRRRQAFTEYDTVRRTIVEETGDPDAQPGRGLQEMRHKILANDPSLDWQPGPRSEAETRVIQAGGNPNEPAHPRMSAYIAGNPAEGLDGFHLPVDRAAVAHMEVIAPRVTDLTRANEDFFARAIRRAVKAGVRHIIELGTGIPTRKGSHVIAREIAGGVRVLYVNADTTVVTFAQEKIRDDATGMFYNPLRDAGGIIDHPETTRLFPRDEHGQFAEPVAILVRDALNYIPDEDLPEKVLADLMAACPPGSYLALSNATDEGMPDLIRQQVNALYKDMPAGQALILRTRAQIENLFDGLELLEPGVVRVDAWESGEPIRELPMLALGGVAIKKH